MKINLNGNRTTNSPGIQKKYNFFDENPQFKAQGEMRAFLRGHQLMRENFYFTDNEGISNIKQVDEHEMIFESSYDDWYILNIQD